MQCLSHAGRVWDMLARNLLSTLSPNAANTAYSMLLSRPTPVLSNLINNYIISLLTMKLSVDNGNSMKSSGNGSTIH